MTADRPGLLARASAVPVWLRVVLGVAALLALSLWLRTTALSATFWIDEGLSVGIADHAFFDIPTVLQQDGSPPLYYLLLHVWMELFGQGQATTHALSLGFALLAIPVALWAGWASFGWRAGAFAALLATVNPFLTYYAQETRMYALVALLSFVVAGSLLQVYVFRRRAYLPVFAVSVAALLYTHNWGLFLTLGVVTAVALCWREAADRRGVLRDAAIGLGAAFVLYLPWIPTLLQQASETGAPWSEAPDLNDVLNALTNLLGDKAVPLGLLFAAGAGLATVWRRSATLGSAHVLASHPQRLAVKALVVLPVVGIVLAFTLSQVSPAWAPRYFAVFVGPLLLLAGIGLAHAGRLGLVALAIVVALWLDPQTGRIEAKSNVRVVAAKIKHDVLPGDLVVSVHPEQMPLLHYYFPPGLKYATALGPAPDPQVFDWRDALPKLEAAGPKRTLDPMVRSLRPGQTLVLTLPIIRTGRWGAPWTKLVRTRSAQWEQAAQQHPLLARIGPQPRYTNKRLPRGVRVVLYRRTSS